LVLQCQTWSRVAVGAVMSENTACRARATRVRR
jgi:hypothetical protein